VSESQKPEKQKPRALGRGLDALLPVPSDRTPSGFAEKSVFLCPIERISPMKGQPRQRINEQALEELAQSIREVGIIEPLVVRRLPSPVPGQDRYELVAGERRWRAAQKAGLKEVMVVVKELSPAAAFELAMIENVQREDLNPIELAESFSRLIKEHSYTQEKLAERIGKDRTTIANSLRLLRLPQAVRSKVITGDLSEGHARALLTLTDAPALEKAADKVIAGRLSVRQTEQLAKQLRLKSEAHTGDPKGAEPGAKHKPASVNVKALEKRLSNAMHTRCEVRDAGGKGEIAIVYSSLDQLDALIEKLLGGS
jgi:ParB family chromosome partitioning protein